ncbi:hypothetical protein BH10ACT1_BH10ACT1_26220 [soil metagenome]
MTKSIPIRAKLALALFIPVLAMFAVSIYEVGRANSEVSAVRQDTDLAGAALGPGSLIRKLQDERNDSALTLVGLRDSASLPTKDLAGSQQAVDEAAATFRAALAKSGPQAEAVYRSALESFEKTTGALRKRMADRTGKPSLAQLPTSNEMWDGYSATIDRFIEANTRLTLLIEDPELRSAAEMLEAVSRQIENLGNMVRTGIISSIGGSDVKGTTKNDVIRAINDFESNRDRIDVLATGSYAKQARGLDENQPYQEAVDLLRAYVETGKLDTTEVIETVARKVNPNVETVASATSSALKSRSTDLRDDAESRRRNFVGLALLVLVAGGAFMILAARSVTRPLLSLTRQAEDMASTRLPAAVQQILDTPLGDDVVIPSVEPVKVKTRDEVREVAVALNSVQSSAIDLAVEQAVLRRNIADSFVNLGRRTQNLIGRQLDFITDLERNETDPATLNNLFKLDHLATRARRNAESLVVLAGLATPRTWAAPIAMGDVVRAALSEVEDYQRVEIRSIGDATVPGRTAADLVHLLAELVENGLSFSPPGRPVEVHGRLTRNGYVLAVLDHGIGMTQEEIDQANSRLAGRESYTVAPSRYLGHYVAGSLAARIGVTVRLDESPTGGIAAKIVLPPEVLDHAPELAVPAAVAALDAPPTNEQSRDGLAPVPALASRPSRSANGHEANGHDANGHDANGHDANGHETSGSTMPDWSTGDAPAAEPERTTEHGLRKRVRSTEAPTPTAPASVPAKPTPTSVPVATGPSPADVAVFSSPKITPPTATGLVPPLARPAPGGPHAAPVAEATASWGTANWPPAATSDAVEAGADEEGPDRTTNGLRKRVPGDQLAASSLTPMIRRAAIPAMGAPDPASAQSGAENLFSVLTNFESGVQRGRDDLAKVTSPADPDVDHTDPTADPNEQEV